MLKPWIIACITLACLAVVAGITVGILAATGVIAGSDSHKNAVRHEAEILKTQTFAAERDPAYAQVNQVGARSATDGDHLFFYSYAQNPAGDSQATLFFYTLGSDSRYSLTASKVFTQTNLTDFKVVGQGLAVGDGLLGAVLYSENAKTARIVYYNVSAGGAALDTEHSHVDIAGVDLPGGQLLYSNGAFYFFPVSTSDFKMYQVDHFSTSSQVVLDWSNHDVISGWGANPVMQASTMVMPISDGTQGETAVFTKTSPTKWRWVQSIPTNVDPEPFVSFVSAALSDDGLTLCVGTIDGDAVPVGKGGNVTRYTWTDGQFAKPLVVVTGSRDLPAPSSGAQMWIAENRYLFWTDGHSASTHIYDLKEEVALLADMPMPSNGAGYVFYGQDRPITSVVPYNPWTKGSYAPVPALNEGKRLHFAVIPGLSHVNPSVTLPLSAYQVGITPI